MNDVLIMIIKMTLLTALYILVTSLVWKYTHNKKVTITHKIIIGILYGLCSVMSTHFGVNFNHSVLNVRDMGPLSAGLFFDPVSGIIAGLIGGIERYIAGTYFGVASFTRIACSVSTCLSGFVAALMSKYIFLSRKPSGTYAFFMGAVVEVFHMYVVFITHKDNINMAFYVVRNCAPGMIIFTGVGMGLSSVLLQVFSHEWENPFRRKLPEEVTISHTFSTWLFAVTGVILVLTLLFSYNVQTQNSIQWSSVELLVAADDIEENYLLLKKADESQLKHFKYYNIGRLGQFEIFDDNYFVKYGSHAGYTMSADTVSRLNSHSDELTFQETIFNTESLCFRAPIRDGNNLLVFLPMDEVLNIRDIQIYEITFSYIILFTVIYVMISLLMQKIVVNNLLLVNESLNRITNGNLDEVVSVRRSLEYASLSDDINLTVSALKGYIKAAEERIEQELEFAKTIQESSLPKNFNFYQNGGFDLYATMDPAKEVGGDFYDFFIAGRHKFAMVIADVSGKGIPAALFMMRAKTTIRNLAESGKPPSEIFRLANDTLSEGNEAEMFVTVWIGIMDTRTGRMVCSNAGHEYPVLMRADGSYELYKQRHSPALATISGIPFREYEITLNPGDRLFVYTDGVPESIDKAEEQYGTDRLLYVLNQHKNSSMDETLHSVRDDISEFAEEVEQFDDITMLGLIYHGPKKKTDK